MNYSLVGNRVVRDDGYVGVQHYSSNGTSVKVEGTTYIFSPQYNVSFSWVAPEHIDRVLALKTRGSCCGHAERLKFVLASLINTYLWHGLDRTGNPK